MLFLLFILFHICSIICCFISVSMYYYFMPLYCYIDYDIILPLSKRLLLSEYLYMGVALYGAE